MKRHISFIIVLIIFILSLGLRWYALTEVEYKMEYDTLNYHNMAKNFIKNGFLGYSTNGVAKAPNAYITPGYPLFLAGIYSIFGDTEAEDIEAVKMVQIIISAVTAVLVYLIGAKVVNKVVGILAALLMAAYPTFLIATVFHLTETVYTFFFILYLYLQIIAFERNKKYLHVLTGFIFGIAVIIRPTVFPFFIVIYLYKRIIEKDKSALKQIIFFILGLLIIMVPWWVRNYLVLGKFILLCTQAGNPLLGGAYPPRFTSVAYYPLKNQMAEGIKAIIKGFAEHPKEYLYWFTKGKLDIIFGQMYLYTFLPQLEWFENLHFAILLGGTMGVFIALIQKNIRIIALYTVMTVGIQLLFIPESRYAFSIMPLLMILFAYIIWQMVYFVVEDMKNIDKNKLKWYSESRLK